MRPRVVRLIQTNAELAAQTFSALQYVNPATNMPDLAKAVRTSCCILKATCANDPAMDCCERVLTCALAPCGSKNKGLKNKLGAAAALCFTGNAASCDETTCCEADTNKCGVGSANLQCTTVREPCHKHARLSKGCKDQLLHIKGDVRHRAVRLQKERFEKQE